MVHGSGLDLFKNTFVFSDLLPTSTLPREAREETVEKNLRVSVFLLGELFWSTWYHILNFKALLIIPIAKKILKNSIKSTGETQRRTCSAN